LAYKFAKEGTGVITLKTKQKIIQLHLDGVSERKIAKQTKKARDTVRKYIKQFKQSRYENIQNLPIPEEARGEIYFKID